MWLVESFLYGVYAGIMFVPIYNALYMIVNSMISSALLCHTNGLGSSL